MKEYVYVIFETNAGTATQITAEASIEDVTNRLKEYLELDREQGVINHYTIKVVEVPD